MKRKYEKNQEISKKKEEESRNERVSNRTYCEPIEGDFLTGLQTLVRNFGDIFFFRL